MLFRSHFSRLNRQIETEIDSVTNRFGPFETNDDQHDALSRAEALVMSEWVTLTPEVPEPVWDGESDGFNPDSLSDAALRLLGEQVAPMTHRDEIDEVISGLSTSEIETVMDWATTMKAINKRVGPT